MELSVTVVEGRNLAPKNHHHHHLLGLVAPHHEKNVTSNPYVQVEVGKEKQKTKKARKDLNPHWNETLFLKAENTSDTLTVSVWDWERIGSDDFMGEVKIPLSEVASAGVINKWYPLSVGQHDGEEVTGEIHLQLKALLNSKSELSLEDLRHLAAENVHEHGLPLASHPDPVPPPDSAVPPALAPPALAPPPALALPPDSEETTPGQPQQVEPKDSSLPLAKALFAWTAENPGELASLEVGAEVFVKDTSDESWWFVVDKAGNEGFVAKNYLEWVQ
jgi:hypothetical protein